MSPNAERLIAKIEAKIAARKAGAAEPEPASDRIDKPTPPKPVMLAARNGRVVDGWAEVRVDPAYEREWHLRQADRAAERAHRKAIDPYNYGHWGPSYDE